MTGHGRSTRNVVLIEAMPETVYRAFLNPEVVAQWLAPGDMTAEVLAFEGREGGEVRMRLTYPAADEGAGKTSTGTDVYRARFVELVPNERVVQAIEFESEDPRFAGTMRMTATLAPTRQGTNLTLDFEDIPVGISLADNRRGTELSLQKLSGLISRTSC
ncbi:MAG: SRPBCC domain-containing protein [Dehalococcoidia bacterium]|nr:SRPBCC domain-containing protein [Dehalococcoidia bacterium]